MAVTRSLNSNGNAIILQYNLENNNLKKKKKKLGQMQNSWGKNKKLG